MGVRANALDDVVQDVFVVVHRNLERFEGSGSITSWIFGIVLRVVRNHRRTLRRKGAGQALASVVTDADLLVAPLRDSPHEQLKKRQASRIWQEVLAQMAHSKAEMLVMVELEGRSVAEIAWLLELPVKTAYSRLRRARLDFSRMVAKRVYDKEQASESAVRRELHFKPYQAT